MRRWPAVLLALTILLTAGLAAQAASPVDNHGLAPESHAPPGVPTRDNFGWTTFTHPAGASHGYVDIRSWIYQTHDATGRPTSWSGVGEVQLSSQVRSVGFRVVLVTGIGPTLQTDVLVTSARKAKLSTGSFDELTFTTSTCEGWTAVRAYVNWSDGTTTGSRTWEVPSDLWNDWCYFR